MTFRENTAQQLSDGKTNSPSDVSNQSGQLESHEASKSGNVNSLKTRKPSRLPIYIRHGHHQPIRNKMKPINN